MFSNSITICLFLHLLIFSTNFIWITAASTTKQPNNAAIPRSKSSKTHSLFGNSVFNNLLREVKMSFCSELEGLLLQMTRPNNALVPLANIDQLLNILTIEYDNPQLIVSILVKLSRKFVEKSVFTQLKAAVILHAVMQSLSQSEAQIAWSKAIESMCQEEDEKYKCNFFALKYIDEVSSYANTAMELETTEFARQYIPYVFELIAARQPTKENTTNKKGTIMVVNKAKKLMQLFQKNQDIQQFGTKEQLLQHALHQQCMDKLSLDEKWIINELKKLYLTNELFEDRELETEIEKVLSKNDPQFVPAKCPTIEFLPASTEGKQVDVSVEKVVAPKGKKSVTKEVKKKAPIVVSKKQGNSSKNVPISGNKQVKKTLSPGVQQSIMKGIDKTVTKAKTSSFSSTSKSTNKKSNKKP